MHMFWLLLAFMAAAQAGPALPGWSPEAAPLGRPRLAAAGNLTGVTHVPSSQTTEYRYDALNRRNQTILPAVVAGGPRTTHAVGYRYDWDNRPTSSSAGGFSAVYDLDGNRVRKTAGGVTIHFLVATVNPTGWAQVVEEHTGTSPGTVSRRYMTTSPDDALAGVGGNSMNSTQSFAKDSASKGLHHRQNA